MLRESRIKCGMTENGRKLRSRFVLLSVCTIFVFTTTLRLLTLLFRGWELEAEELL